MDSAWAVLFPLTFLFPSVLLFHPLSSWPCCFSLSLFSPLAPMTAMVLWFRAFSSPVQRPSPTKTVSLTYHPCKSYFNCLSLVSFFGREAAGRLEFPCFCSGVGTFLGMRFNWRPLVPCKLPFPRHGDLSLPLPVWGHCTKKIRGIWFGVHVDLHEQYITVVLERDMEDHVFFR